MQRDSRSLSCRKRGGADRSPDRFPGSAPDRRVGVVEFAPAVGLGGHGMQVIGDIPVTAGEGLWIYVGGNGQAGATNGTGGAGGLMEAPMPAVMVTVRTSRLAAVGPPTCAPRRQCSVVAWIWSNVLARDRPTWSQWEESL